MDREIFIQALRQAADIYEKNPDVPIPFDVDLLTYVFTKDDLAKAARGLGRIEKSGDDAYFQVERRLHPRVKIRVYTDRENVCRKVVKHELLPAEPEKIIPALPERTKEIIEWVCDEPLLAPAPVEDQASELRELVANGGANVVE